MEGMGPWPGEAEWLSWEGVPEAVTLGLGLIKGPWDFVLGREDQRNTPGQQARSQLHLVICHQPSSPFGCHSANMTEFPPECRKCGSTRNTLLIIILIIATNSH